MGGRDKGNTFFSWRRISQPARHRFAQAIAGGSEIRNSAAEKSESESEGGQKFLPPNPLPFCPPERSVFCSAFGGAINRSFVQKRFALRSVIAKKERAGRSEFNSRHSKTKKQRTVLCFLVLGFILILFYIFNLFTDEFLGNF